MCSKTGGDLVEVVTAGDAQPRETGAALAQTAAVKGSCEVGD